MSLLGLFVLDYFKGGYRGWQGFVGRSIWIGGLGVGLYCFRVMRFSGIHGMVCISNSLGCGSLMVGWNAVFEMAFHSSMYFA